MPVSWDFVDKDVTNWIVANVAKTALILDIGPGAGKWGKVLKAAGYANVDGLEIHAPYVAEFGLDAIYRQVIVGDVRMAARSWLKPYALCVFGDSFEHLSREEASAVLRNLQCPAVIVVPHELPQIVMEGNPHETHRQDDLSEAVMLKRFPGLTRLAVRKITVAGKEREGGAYLWTPAAAPARKDPATSGMVEPPSFEMTRPEVVLADCCGSMDNRLFVRVQGNWFLLSWFANNPKCKKCGHVPTGQVTVLRTPMNGKHCFCGTPLDDKTPTHKYHWDAADFLDNAVMGLAKERS
jgi:hypothetical protein